MILSDNSLVAAVAHADAAPQRSNALESRGRGPHPLPALIALLAQVCGPDRDRLQAALAGVRAYQQHPYRRMVEPLPIIARSGSASLRDYGGSGPLVVFVPSLINPPTVLDLAPDNSLLRWLATQGLHPLMVDWGELDEADMALRLADMVSERVVPLLRSIQAPFALAGYCLGGTLALAAAGLVAPTRIALVATPWHFSGYEDAQRTDIADHFAAVDPLIEALGCLPMEVLQPGFWALDRETVVNKFVAFGRRDPDSAAARAFVDLEDWANSGPPLPPQVARDLFHDLFAGDLSGIGEWHIAGVPIRPETLQVPILDIVASRDRIVPAASALNLGQRLDLPLGHVGMIVSSRAPALLWEPLAHWLRDA
jgi:polyhydroxyalkanoate synthase